MTTLSNNIHIHMYIKYTSFCYFLQVFVSKMCHLSYDSHAFMSYYCVGAFYLREKANRPHERGNLNLAQKKRLSLCY